MEKQIFKELYTVDGTMEIHIIETKMKAPLAYVNVAF